MSEADPGPAEAGRPRLRLVFGLLLIVVLAVAAHMRLRAAFETVVSPPLRGDSIGYVSAAYNMKTFGVFSKALTWSQPAPSAPAPDAILSPGYPAVLAVLLEDRPDYRFLRRALLLQALIGIAAVGLTYVFAIQVLSRRAAIVAAALVAITPQLVSLGASLLTETLFTLTVVVFLLCLVRAARREAMGWYALAGLALGATALVRPTLQYLPFLLVPAVVWLSTRTPWKNVGALLLGFAIAFGPWLVRNQVQTGTIGDSTLIRSTLLHGSYPDFMYQGQPQSLGFPYRFDPQEASIRSPWQALQRIGSNLKADPATTLRWYFLSKPLRFHDWAFVEGAGDIFINPVTASPYLVRREFIVTSALMHIVHWPLMILSFLGTAMAMLSAIGRGSDERRRAMGLLAVVVIFVVGVHVIGFPLGRYSVPFRPLTFVLALYALGRIAGYLRSRLP